MAQESACAAASQAPALHGPSMYCMPDWEAAHRSVQALAALEPELVVTGHAPAMHGPAMHGPAMRSRLHQQAAEFAQAAVPRHGRDFGDSARPDDGSAYVRR